MDSADPQKVLSTNRGKVKPAFMFGLIVFGLIFLGIAVAVLEWWDKRVDRDDFAALQQGMTATQIWDKLGRGPDFRGNILDGKGGRREGWIYSNGLTGREYGRIFFSGDGKVLNTSWTDKRRRNVAYEAGNRKRPVSRAKPVSDGEFTIHVRSTSWPRMLDKFYWDSGRPWYRISVTVTCHRSRDKACLLDPMDFKLVCPSGREFPNWLDEIGWRRSSPPWPTPGQLGMLERIELQENEECEGDLIFDPPSSESCNILRFRNTMWIDLARE